MQGFTSEWMCSMVSGFLKLSLFNFFEDQRKICSALTVFCAFFHRSNIAPLFCGGVASHVCLPGPLLPLVLWCMGPHQQRSLRSGVSTSWFLYGGNRGLRRPGSLPVTAAAAAVHASAAEPTAAAAADPADPTLPATAATAVSAAAGGARAHFPHPSCRFRFYV